MKAGDIVVVTRSGVVMLMELAVASRFFGEGVSTELGASRKAQAAARFT